MSADTPIIADGGVSNCEFLMQQVSNLTGRRIVCPVNVDTTAIGTAYMAMARVRILERPERD